ncbi:MAG TPA: class I mannose-6-phosphate isomerase [Sphingomicrobium sp.]
MKLRRSYVEKPWGRTDLPPQFDAPADRKIGEIWFTGDTDLSLLAKYIFTSERLSIQVHPGDEQARVRGLPHGKTECWYVLEAESGSTIGLGLKREVSEGELKAAALDGSIEQLMDWRPVRAGDFFFVPAGTIHAIGGGLSLLEFQQNSDVTYRLYDYGRPRELHVEDAVAVARREPCQRESGHGEGVLIDGPFFTLIHGREDTLRERQRWVLPLEGQVQSRSDVAGPGECLLLEPGETLLSEGARMLVGASV